MSQMFILEIVDFVKDPFAWVCERCGKSVWMARQHVNENAAEEYPSIILFAYYPSTAG